MRTADVRRFEQRLDLLFAKASALIDDLELQSHLARYLCVLISGYLENAVADLVSEYAKTRGNPNLHRFVQRRMRGFQNPRMNKILDVIRDFDEDWAIELQTGTEGEIKDSVDSVVANRHKIAHGESVGVSLAFARQYYLNAVRLVDLIERRCER